jgi:hypothetical protein
LAHAATPEFHLPPHPYPLSTVSYTQTLDNTHTCGKIETNPSRASPTCIEARAEIKSNMYLAPRGLWLKMCGKWCFIFIPFVILGVVVGVWAVLGPEQLIPKAAKLNNTRKLEVNGI